MEKKLFFFREFLWYTYIKCEALSKSNIFILNVFISSYFEYTRCERLYFCFWFVHNLWLLINYFWEILLENWVSSYFREGNSFVWVHLKHSREDIFNLICTILYKFMLTILNWFRVTKVCCLLCNLLKLDLWIFGEMRVKLWIKKKLLNGNYLFIMKYITTANAHISTSNPYSC